MIGWRRRGREREATRDRLTAASLARLNTPDPDPATFATDGRFALTNLPALTARPDQIKHLRQAILHLATQGRLISQKLADEPASDLLMRTAANRERERVAHTIRKSKQPPPNSAADGTSKLPERWVHCALGEVSIVTDPNPSYRYPDYTDGTVPILSTQEFLGRDGWRTNEAKLTTEAYWRFQCGICRFEEGDIVFARKGRLGLPRFLPPIDRFTFSHTVFVIKPVHGVLPEYLLWFLRRAATIEWLTNEMNENTGVPTLGKGKLERLPVALPPLAEQHRIVAKVDAAMALCDRLDVTLAEADTSRGRLLEALLKEALAPQSAANGAIEQKAQINDAA